MSNRKILFSPTGGTARAADILCRGLGDAWEVTDLMDRDIAERRISFTPADICVVAVPSFAGRVPKPAGDRLASMKGNQARAILLCAYGNRLYEDTLVELKDILEGAGFRCVGAVAAVTEHSVVRTCAAGRPDKEDEAVLLAFAGQIRAKLEAGEDRAVEVPGNRPYREAGRSHMMPYGTDKCISCGLCAARCPTGAIDGAAPTLTDGDRCIACMACVALCPVGARELDPAMHAGITRRMTELCAVPRENELFL